MQPNLIKHCILKCAINYAACSLACPIPIWPARARASVAAPGTRAGDDCNAAKVAGIQALIISSIFSAASGLTRSFPARNFCVTSSIFSDTSGSHISLAAAIAHKSGNTLDDNYFISDRHYKFGESLIRFACTKGAHI